MITEPLTVWIHFVAQHPFPRSAQSTDISQADNEQEKLAGTAH